jgi:hypothetical protein
MTTISENDLKCLRKHLKPLILLLDKLDKGVDNAPLIEKKETIAQGVNRYKNIIAQKEAAKINKKTTRK